MEIFVGSEDEIKMWVLPVMNLHMKRSLSKSSITFANAEGIEFYTNHIADELVFGLTARIANKDLGSFKYPENWWEAVKERWAPKWFLKKYPVSYTVYTGKVFYPSIAIPDHREYVQFYRKGRDY